MYGNLHDRRPRLLACTWSSMRSNAATHQRRCGPSRPITARWKRLGVFHLLLVASQQLASCASTSAAANAKGALEAAWGTPLNVQAATESPNGSVRGQIGVQYWPLEGSPPAVRSGTYYLPSGYKDKELPLLVLFHGLGKSGRAALSQKWVPLAEQYKFIVVAPDSGNQQRPGGWEVPTADKAPSNDMSHAQACLEWVLKLPHVKGDFRHVASVGVSNGGSIAASLASRWPVFTHSIVLHGTFFVSQLGRHTTPLWVSTGSGDTIVLVEENLSLLRNLRQARPEWPPMAFRVFPGAHSLHFNEQRGAVHWFLGHRDTNSGATSAVTI